MDHADTRSNGDSSSRQAAIGVKDSASATNDILETIRAMRMQEATKYKIENYFALQKAATACSDTMEVDPTGSNGLDIPIDAECRFRMSEWCFQIVDFCSFKRETVAIAMSCLDRFLVTESGREAYLDRNKFQLAAMVSLYSCVKIHEQEAMDPNLMATLSRGVFTPDEIELMEAKILSAIEFRVNPPTALAFCNLFLELIPNHVVNYDSRDTVLELAKFQTEIAVSDVDLMCINPSSIALGALINSFDSLDMDMQLQQHILGVLSAATQVDIQASLFRDVRIRLYESLTGQGENEFCSSISPQPSSPRLRGPTTTATFYEAPANVMGG